MSVEDPLPDLSKELLDNIPDCVQESPSTRTDDRAMDERINEPATTYTDAFHKTPLVNNHRPGLVIETSSTNYSVLNTTSYDNNGDDDNEPPRSVIHAPFGFREFRLNPTQHGSKSIYKSDTTSSVESDIIMKLPVSSKDEKKIKKFASGPISPSPLTTAIESIKDWSEHATPQAQTMQDFEDIDRISNARNIDDIPKGAGVEKIDQEVDSTPIRRILKMRPIFGSESEIKALRAALDGCWSLCNTLASLSYIHRERLKFKGDVQEEAWISCWRLCQELYDSQDINTNVSQASLTLDLCRHFCQALFDARHRDNELADSVLRVSFELNNHLYNTHDRNLPDAFRERTLAFYVTLCHRLMKQRTRNTNTEPLLSACWSLAELLFSIRQNERESRQSNEDLLSSAVQACWELCDIFREGWTRRSVRNSDRGTPRPSQATFAQTVTQTEQPDLYLNERLSGQQGNPETPTTIFEDTVSTSPDEAPVQNIFVLGQISTHVSQTKWPSNSSSVSGQTQSSERSANTITILPNTPNLTSLKVLIIKAAMNSGFQRSGPQSLSSFVKSLSSDAFGSMTWQISLLRSYKRMVAFDPTFQYVGPQARASAIEIAGAVQETVQRGQCPWLNDLYRLVFGFRMEEAVRRKDIILQT